MRGSWSNRILNLGTYYSTERNGTERLFRKIPILRNGLKPALDNYPAYNIHFSAE